MLYPKDTSIKVSSTPDKLRIEWAWNRKQGFLAILASFALIIVISYVCIVLPTSPRFRTADKDMVAILGGLYALFFLVFGLSHGFNTTIIEATKRGVVCFTKPFSWDRRSDPIASKPIQFFVRPSVSTKYHGWIYVLNQNSECFLLVNRTPSKIATYQICHELQDWYGLEDLPVYGQNTQPHQPGPRIRSSNT